MSIKKNYGFNLLNSLLNIVFPIITFPYAARLLSPEGIGETQFIFSFAQYFSILAAFGLPIYGVKVIASAKTTPDKVSQITSSLILFSMITASIAFLLYLFISLSFLDFESNSKEFLIAGVLILFGFLNVDWFFAGRQEFKVIAIRSFIVKVLSLILLFTLVREETDTLAYIIFLVFLYIGNFILNFTLLINRTKLSFKHLAITEHLKPMSLIFSMAVATTIYTTLDVVLLGLLSEDEEVGLYTAAVKLTKVSLPILTSLGLVIIPRATQLLATGTTADQNQLFSKSFSFIVLIATPMTIGIFLLGTEAINLFSGSQFSDAVIDVQILSLLPILIGIGHFASFQILVPLNKNKAISISTFFGMALFLTMAFLLIPSNGSTGAAIATITTELIVTMLYLIFIPRSITTQFPWSKLLKAAIACLVFVPIIWTIQSILDSDALIMSLSIISCAFAYFTIQFFLFRETLVLEVFRFIKTRGNG